MMLSMFYCNAVKQHQFKIRKWNWEKYFVNCEKNYFACPNIRNPKMNMKKLHNVNLKIKRPNRCWGIFNSKIFISKFFIYLHQKHTNRKITGDFFLLSPSSILSLHDLLRGLPHILACDHSIVGAYSWLTSSVC